MRHLSLLALAIALPAAAQAPATPAPAAPAPTDRIQLAVCQTGAGCTTCDASLSHAQADASLGALGLVADSPGHIVTVMRNKQGEWTWYYDTRRTPQELDRTFGGPGRGKQAGCAPVPGGHPPRDGVWTVHNETPVAKNCPAGVAENLGTLQLFRSGPVVFRKPFSAADALPGENVAWLQTGPDTHVGSFAPAGNAAMRARYQLQVTSPEAMAGKLQVVVPIPGRAPCEVAMDFHYRRTGDTPAG